MANVADIVVAGTDAVNALNRIAQNLTVALQPVVASVTGPSSVGALTFTSSQPAAFMSITTSSGVAYLVPLYPAP